MALLGFWLLTAVLLGATLLVVHAVLLRAVFRAERARPADRWLAIVPLFLPFVGFRVGLRLLPAFWCVLVVAYLILRLSR